MELRFDTKTVWITGASSGIGRATALAFAGAGAQVIVSDIDEQGGLETVDQIAGLSGLTAPAAFERVDVTDESSVQAVVQKIIIAHSHNHLLDIGINNAEIEGPNARLTEHRSADWQRVVDVNLNGVFYCMKAELDVMMRQRSGAIINIASVAGLVGFPWHAGYAASKHAVVGLTRSTALEYARKGIRINAVCPGFTDTPMVSESVANNPDFAPKLLGNIPMRRLGEPDEIAAAILFLASKHSGFTTGHTMVLDGGITAG